MVTEIDYLFDVIREEWWKCIKGENSRKVMRMCQYSSGNGRWILFFSSSPDKYLYFQINLLPHTCHEHSKVVTDGKCVVNLNNQMTLRHSTLKLRHIYRVNWT